MPSVQFVIETESGSIARRDGACFGSYNMYLKEAQFDKRGRDAPVERWVTHYRLDPKAVFYYDTERWERATMLRAFNSMYEHWIDPDQMWFIKRSNGQYDKFTVTDDAPYYVMLNMMSLFRMKADMPCFMHHWVQLERVFKHLKYDPNPWTIYWMAVSLSGPSNSSNVNWVSNPDVICGVNRGHMPYDSDWVSIDEVKWMQHWNRDNLRDGYTRVHSADRAGEEHRSLHIAKPLHSMYEQFKATRELSYYGREGHFVGRSDKRGSNWMKDEAKAYGLVANTSSPVPSSFSLYSRVIGNTTINLFDFIQEVIIPHQL